MSSPADSEVPSLARALRRRDLIGILLNTMVGSGMLAAPSKVVKLADGWSFAVLGASALLMIPLILVFCDLGSRFSGTGGPYLYARKALPGWTSFSVGWLLWISQALSIATLLNLLVSYLAGFFPALGEGLPRAAVILTLGATVTGITLRGIHQSALVSNLLIALKGVFVVGFIVAGVAFLHPARLAVHHAPPDPMTFAQAVLIYIFAYTGFERAAVVAGEARDPRRDVPISLLIALVVATLAYAAVLLVCVGVLHDPAATDRPLAEVGRQLFGAAGAAAISAGAITVMAGTILVVAVSMPRMLLALSEQEQAPPVLGAIHRRWRTPHVAILLSGALSFGSALFSDLLGALTFATATRVLAYILCCVALWRLSRRPDAPPARFALPARGLVVVACGGLLTAVLLLGAVKELPALAGALALGLVLYGLTRLRRPPAAAEAPRAPASYRSPP